MDELKLKIVGGGNIENTYVIDPDSGRVLKRVKSIKQVHRFGVGGLGHKYEVTFEVDSPDFLYTGDLVAH